MARKLRKRGLSDINRDARKLDRERARLDVSMEQIIGEQEAIIKASARSIKAMNAELEGLRARLKKYVSSRKPVRMDAESVELFDTYKQKLQERGSLQKAISIAEESITAAKLHAIPGEV